MARVRALFARLLFEKNCTFKLCFKMASTFLSAAAGIADAIIIDNGTGFIKAGYSNLNQPNISFPSLFGKPRHPNAKLDDEGKSSFIGNEARLKQAALLLENPIENGVVVNWDIMEQLW